MRGIKKIFAGILTAAMILSMSSTTMQIMAEEQEKTATVSETTGAIVEELRIGTTSDIEPLTAVSDSGSFGNMNYNAFCSGTMLVRDENNEMAPNLMTDWEIAEDGSYIIATFATDQGITWHDGEPFTIDDVIFSIDFNNNVINYGNLNKIYEVEKLSDTQLKLYVEDNAAYFTLGNSAIFAKVFPKHIWENIEDPANYTGEDRVIGCGPYKLIDVDEDARTLTFEAVADTYMGREITVKKVVVRSYDSQDALVMALVNGEVDAMSAYSSPISATMLDAISGVEGLDAGKSINQGLFQLLFGFDQQPTDDLEFRKAVRLALNYELLAETIGGEDGEIPGAGIIPSNSIGYDSSIPALYQDIEEANEVLEAAGYVDVDGDGYREMPDGTELDVLVTPKYDETKAALYRRICEVIMDSLDKVGVKCTLDEESIRNSEVESQRRNNGEYELLVLYSTQGMAYYKTAYLYMFDDPENLWVSSGTCELPEYINAYKSLLNALGPDEFDAALKELQQINVEECIGIGLCWDMAYYPYRTDKYTGWTNYPGWGVINPETWYSLRTIE